MPKPTTNSFYRYIFISPFNTKEATMNEEMEKEYQDFYLKFLNKTRELREDFNKLSDINKYRFEKNINILLKAEFPNLLKFLQK